MVSRNSPQASVRVESIGFPPPSIAIWCRTAQAPASGRATGPPRSTRPETTTPCATTSPLPHSTRTARTAKTATLRRELPEVFRIEVLEVGLQRIRVERPSAGLAARLPRLDRREREQALAREDRRLEPERHRDRVRGAGVDLDHRIAAVDVELGVIRVVLDLGDDDLPEIRAQAEDDLLQEIVRERPSELHPRQLHRDRARLRRPDPDREHPLPFLFLQDDDRRVRRAVEAQMRDANLDHSVAQVPISHDARYFCFSGVSVSMATPMAASFSRPMSASSSRGILCTSFDSRCA